MSKLGLHDSESPVQGHAAVEGRTQGLSLVLPDLAAVPVSREDAAWGPCVCTEGQAAVMTIQSEGTGINQDCYRQQGSS